MKRTVLPKPNNQHFIRSRNILHFRTFIQNLIFPRWHAFLFDLATELKVIQTAYFWDVLFFPICVDDFGSKR